MFLCNAWYVAAWEREVGDTPHAITILGEQVAIYRRDTFMMDSYNFLTPVDETTTRYFWFQMRNVAPDDADVSRRFAASVRGAFEEDKVILEASHRGIAGSTTPNINLRTDSGGIRFRHRLDQMIAAEGSASANGGRPATVSTTVGA